MKVNKYLQNIDTRRRTQEQKGRNTMRTIIYGVKELSTGKIVYVNYYQSECIRKIEELGEGYELRHQWRSF